MGIPGGIQDVQDKSHVIAGIIFLVLLGILLIVFLLRGGTGNVTSGTTMMELSNNPTYKLACELYARDIYVKKPTTKPGYPCVMSCPETNTLGYCPEEMYMQAVLVQRAKEVLKVDNIDRSIEQELYLLGDGVRTMYNFLLSGDERAEVMKDGRSTTEHFVLYYDKVYAVLKRFIEEKNLRVLDGLADALSGR